MTDLFTYTPIFRLADGDEIVFRLPLFMCASEAAARALGQRALPPALRFENVTFTGRVWAVLPGDAPPRISGIFCGKPVYIIGGPSMQDESIPTVEQAHHQIDFTEDAVPTLSKHSVAQLTDLGQRALLLRTRIAQAEEQLKQQKEQLRQLEEDVLPSLMDAAKMTQYRFQNGTVITLGDEYTASLVKSRLAEQCAWLAATGNDGLIANEVVAEFPKGKQSEAQRAVALLVDHGISAEARASLHTGQIKALARELREAGKAFPFEMFGVRVVRKVTITVPGSGTKKGS